ncbi:hypothetical protein SISSUDRAFT_1066735 [Sistotremastrum suecicum HHB10207 ss-3]|uniref:Uncharacterized protein n=1 Tax=Sistotremastrum suecicum HHB10207 ss-3 TaxID=1314776 RepID=A0A165XY53_9AGAM|nr:hypothetical protein SISSUDRAFT_1066735 [Sistotremastrum suecicum HHB10207 ss-3]
MDSKSYSSKAEDRYDEQRLYGTPMPPPVSYSGFVPPPGPPPGYYASYPSQNPFSPRQVDSSLASWDGSPPPLPQRPYQNGAPPFPPPQRSYEDMGYSSQGLQGPGSSGYARYPQPGSSSVPLGTPSTSSRASQLLGKIVKRDPLNPPPPSFSRAPDPRYPYPAFQPMWLLGSGKKGLDSCFPSILPTSFMNPHPFASHDVDQSDWIRFVEDIQIAGGLTGQQRVVSNVVPLVAQMSFVVGLFATKAIETHMKKGKEQPVIELIEIWNNQFFRLRRMNVILVKGNQPLMGSMYQTLNPPVVAAPYGRSRSASSSSSSSSSSDDRKGKGRDYSRKQMKRDRRDQRRGRRSRNSDSDATSDSYHLFVTPA